MLDQLKQVFFKHIRTTTCLALLHFHQDNIIPPISLNTLVSLGTKLEHKLNVEWCNFMKRCLALSLIVMPY